MRTWSFIAAFIGLLVAATSAYAGEMTIDVSRASVRPGEVLRARVAWRIGERVFFQGRAVADWKLTDSTGRVVNRGRKRVRVRWRESDNPPYRFRVRARVPRRTPRGGIVLSVLVHYGTSSTLGEYEVEASASVPLLLASRRVMRSSEVLIREGQLVRDGPDGMLPRIDLGSGQGGPRLFGAAVSEILADPAYDGATVRVTTRTLRDNVFRFDALPDQEVTAVEWLDPPATRVGFVVVSGVLDQRARLRSRIPPADLLLAPTSWRTLLEASRAPAVLRSAEELDAFAEALRPALDTTSDPTVAFEGTDFATYDIVAVFTGTTERDAYRIAPLSIHRNDRTQTTWVRYVVASPASRARGEPSAMDACCIFRIPKFEGEVRVAREAWIPRPPRWW